MIDMTNGRPLKERIIEENNLNRDYYTPYEVADLLGFHYNTVRRMIKEGELPATKISRSWRIRKVDLEKFVTPSNIKLEGKGE
jgi:excisionase family DNA binding protein